MRRSLKTIWFSAPRLLTIVAAGGRAALRDTEAQLTASGAQSRESPEWRVCSGPFGRGSCLSLAEAGGVALVIAPPGVPLDPPEAVLELAHWRVARWRSGALIDTPHTLDVEEVLSVAPSNRTWILDRTREEYRRNVAADHAVDDGALLTSAFPSSPRDILCRHHVSRQCLRAVAAEGASPLRIADIGPHALAAYVGVSPPHAPIKELVRAVNSPLTHAQFQTRVALASETFGADAVREALIALVHARTRCRSARYLPVVRAIGDTPGRRMLTETIKRAPTALALERTLSDLEPRTSALTAELATVLYSCSMSRWWRVTSGLRMLFAMRALSGARRSLLALRICLAAWRRRLTKSGVPMSKVPAVPDTGTGLLLAIDGGPREGRSRMRGHLAAAGRVRCGALPWPHALRVLVGVVAATAAMATGARQQGDWNVEPESVGHDRRYETVAIDVSGSVTSVRERQPVVREGLPFDDRVSWFAQTADDGRRIWYVQQDHQLGMKALWRDEASTSTLGTLIRPITRGRYDSYISNWARYFSELGDPVRLRALPSARRDHQNAISQRLVRRARARIQMIFREQGVANVRWLESSPGVGRS